MFMNYDNHFEESISRCTLSDMYSNYLLKLDYNQRCEMNNLHIHVYMKWKCKKYKE